MTDDEFWALLKEKQSRFARPSPRSVWEWFQKTIAQAMSPRELRLHAIEAEAGLWNGEIPLWLKNELKYFDVDLNLYREVALKIQWFRIAEETYNGADEDELWWKPGRNCEIEPPSQRLTQRAPLDQGCPD